MSSITYRISQLRRENRRWRERQEEERLKANTLNQKRIMDAVAQLEYNVYHELKKEIYASCGVTGPIKLLAGRRSLNLVTRSEKQLIVEEFRRRTGMDLEVDEKGGSDYVYVKLSDKLKVCTVMVDGKSVVLDYLLLNVENEARRVKWGQFLPEFAVAIINECRKCLETMPNKHLGIPERMLVLKYNDSSLLGRNGSTPFAGEFSIGSLKACYHKLSEVQAKELAEKVNSMISHGEVEIDEPDNAMWVKILRRPEKVLEQPYFDYEDFYKKYEEVTPELQRVLNIVASNVAFPEMEEQLLTLDPQRKLVYWFNRERKLDFKLLKERLLPVHKQHLIDVVNNHIHGAKVTDAQFLNREESWGSMRGCAHGTMSLDERIEFTVELDETAASSKETAKQLQLERVIWRIKHCRAQYFANILVEAVLDDIYGYGRTKELFAENGKYWQVMCDKERLVVTLKGHEARLLRAEFDCKPEDLKVNLKEVEDEAFINRIAAAVQRRTDGMMSISLDAIQGLSYKLVFRR